MIYSDFKELKLSQLALGCMRLPKMSEKDSDIDFDATVQMVDYALKNGVNYFDTAFGYHLKQSETTMGKILSRYPRDSFYLATKFPGYDLSLIDKVEEVFQKQLENCRVDYFDFYLFHNVCEMNIEQYLDPRHHIHEYLVKMKKEGKIRHLGFSTHGNLDTMKRFLDAYADDLEFCQLQINWLDWDFQNAKEKVELVKKYNIPIWVMEPVRGGKLVNIPKVYEDKLKALRPDAKTVDWAFYFLQSLPDVKVTLSGMSNMQQLTDNIKTYETAKPLNELEMQTLLQIAKDMTSKKTLPCTACHYCVEHCPMELDIPWLVELYNEYVYSDGGFIAPAAVAALSDDKKPSACIACRACEGVCPQNIKISEMMSDFAGKLK